MVSSCAGRAAIEEANANDASDTITFSPGASGTIILTLGKLRITDDITGPDLSIEGPEASGLTVSGNNNSGVLAILGSEATIDRITITGGSSADPGAGITNSSGTLTLANSTVSGNTAAGFGGGILKGGGTATMTNTIVARNTAPTNDPDVSRTFTSQGNNLIGNTSGSSGWSSSDLQNVNPLLGPLQNNGGPTDTHALLQGSPAIDRGTNAGCVVSDQRGFLRQDGDADGTLTCDIGAFEAANTKPTITNLKPAPGSSTRDRTPLIAATVRDEQTNLAKTNIKLFMDGNKKTTFSYDRSTDRLSYTSGRLSFGRHTVKIS